MCRRLFPRCILFFLRLRAFFLSVFLLLFFLFFLACFYGGCFFLSSLKVWTPPTTTPNKQHQQQQYCCCCLLLLLPCNIQQLAQHATLDYQWSNHVATRDDHTRTASQGNENLGRPLPLARRKTPLPQQIHHRHLSLSLSFVLLSVLSSVSFFSFFLFSEMILNPIFETACL